MTADTPPPVSAPVACVDRPESRAYVAAVKQRAYGRWTPEVQESGGSAVIAFRLDEHGQVLSSEVRTKTSEAAARSATEALAAAAPYAEMPPEARCLARMKLIARFEATPGVPAPAAQRAPEPAQPSLPRWLLPLGTLAFAFVATRLGRKARKPPDPAQSPPTLFSQPGGPIVERGSGTRAIALITVGLAVAALLYVLASKLFQR